MDEAGEVTCLKDAIDIIDNLKSSFNDHDNFVNGIDKESFPYGLWFRGEGDHEKPLTPGILGNKMEMVKFCTKQESLITYSQESPSFIK